MCGILGFTGTNGAPSDERFEKALDRLAHRGPDDSGTLRQTLEGGGRVLLGHRRLSILDLSPLGHQPMVSPRTGAAIVFNGEIYNFQLLREELQARGHAFSSTCDTEVALAAYEEWGASCVERFDGMFALGIWDPRAGKLLLARDPVGIKPLYYWREAGWVGFASELVPLASLGCAPIALKPEAAGDYFFLGFLPGEQTLLKGFSKLLPGHLAEFDLRSDQFRLRRYWDVLDHYSKPPLDADEPELTDRVEGLLSESVRRQLVSDVPLGAFLSGGIDSSLVVALMSQVASGRVKTFTIGFTEPEADEAPFARRIAERLGTEHHELYVSPQNVREELLKIPGLYDEPFADTSCVPTCILSRMTREHVTVALSGDGGDELYYGYDRYRRASQFRAFQSLPRPLRAGLVALLGIWPSHRVRGWAKLLQCPDLARAYFHQLGVRTEDLVPAAPEGLFGLRTALEVQRRLGAGSWRNVPSATDFLQYLPDDLLTKVDRASMAVSLEVRVPVIDQRFVEFSARLPLSMKLRDGTTKYLLKKVLARHVPPQLWDRPKQGFAIPLAQWFRKELKSWVLDELTGQWDWTLGVISKPTALRLIDLHMRERADYSRTIYSLLSWRAWVRGIGLVR